MKWDRVLSSGKVFVSWQSGKRRRYIYYGGKKYKYSVVLWNVSHPDDLLKRGEVVHHEDKDTINDAVGNFKKLTISQHMSIHSASASNPFRGRKHTKKTRMLMSKIAIATGRRPPSRKGIRQMKWNFDEAVELRKGEATWTELSRRYKVSPEAVQAAFGRRGLS